MRLRKTTSYSVRILMECAAADGKLVTARDLAGRLDLTQLNIFKIIQMLSSAGFVEAVRGRHGGFKLARPAKEIRIGELVRTTEATEIALEAIEEGVAKSRPLNALFDEALEAFIAVLDQHTLADLVRSQPAKKKPRSLKASLDAEVRRRSTAKA